MLKLLFLFTDVVLSAYMIYIAYIHQFKPNQWIESAEQWNLNQNPRQTAKIIYAVYAVVGVLIFFADFQSTTNWLDVFMAINLAADIWIFDKGILNSICVGQKVDTDMHGIYGIQSIDVFIDLCSICNIIFIMYYIGLL